MATLVLDDNTKFTFSNTNELKIFIYEKFGYPEIKDEVEESWYKNGKADFEKKKYSNAQDLLSDLKK